MNFWKTFGASLLAFVVVSVVTSIIFVTFCIGVILNLSIDTENKGISNDSILYINLNENIVDAPLTSAMGSLDPLSMSISTPLALIDVLSAIENAEKDSRIKGICIHCDGQGVVSTANIEEIRFAIEKFKHNYFCIIWRNSVL